MVEFSATIDDAAVRAFDSAIEMMRKELGSQSEQAPRRSAIMICKSLRAGTRMARRKRPIVATPTKDCDKPKWMSNPKRRRWTIILPQKDGLKFQRYIRGQNHAEQKSSVRKMYGTLFKYEEWKFGTRGLAKRAWGWVMHNIFSGAAPDTPWHKRRRSKGDPKAATQGSYSIVQKDRGVAVISNRLEYAKDALKISLDAAIEKATSAIVKCIATKRIRNANKGMSAADIRAEAEVAKREFLRKFKY